MRFGIFFQLTNKKKFNMVFSLISVSQVLGFGLMDAEALVTRAKTWVSVPHQLYCLSSDMFLIQYVVYK